MNNYFSHDSNARNDEKIIRLRMKYKSAGYGIYFMILERMRESKNYMCVKDYNLIAFDLREDAGLVKSVIEEFGLFVFTEDGKYFYSESFLKRMKEKDGLRDKRSKAGSHGASRRWKDEGTATDEKKDTTEEQESKEIVKPDNPNEINEENFISTFNYYLKYFHSKITPIKRLTDKRLVLLTTILEHGYTKEDISKVMQAASSSLILNGRGNKSFVPDFDWIFTENNFVRILEGNFSNNK